MEADLMFHPVGQGLFYTGQIRCQDESFNFVYDCGTISGSTANAIKKYKRYLNGYPIDMLVISHFHSDHTSGIHSLLDKQSVKTVIIPFLTFEERLEILLHEYNSKTLAGRVEFLLNPYKYFVEKNVEEIIIVIHKENNEGMYENKITTLDSIEFGIPADDKYTELLAVEGIKIGVIGDDKILQKDCWHFAFYADDKHKSKFDFSKAAQEVDNLIQATNNIDRKLAINRIKQSYNVNTNVLNETSLIGYFGTEVQNATRFLRIA